MKRIFLTLSLFSLIAVAPAFAQEEAPVNNSLLQDFNGNGLVEIAAGLEDGDLVAAAANSGLADGQRVRAAVP